MALCVQPCCLQYSTQDGFTSCVRRSFGRHPMSLASPIAWNFQCSPDFTFTASHRDLRTSNRNSPATGYLCPAERELTWVDLLQGPHSLCSLGQSRPVLPDAVLSSSLLCNTKPPGSFPSLQYIHVIFVSVPLPLIIEDLHKDWQQ